MQERSEDNNILMYSTHCEGVSIVPDTFTKSLKGKFIKKWQLIIPSLILVIWLNYYTNTTILINNTYRSIGEKPIDADCFALAEEPTTKSKNIKFKVSNTVMITK